MMPSKATHSVVAAFSPTAATGTSATSGYGMNPVWQENYTKSILGSQSPIQIATGKVVDALNTFNRDGAAQTEQYSTNKQHVLTAEFYSIKTHMHRIEKQIGTQQLYLQGELNAVKAEVATVVRLIAGISGYYQAVPNADLDATLSITEEQLRTEIKSGTASDALEAIANGEARYLSNDHRLIESLLSDSAADIRAEAARSLARLWPEEARLAIALALKTETNPFTRAVMEGEYLAVMA